jgi:hypothetical protein
MVFTRIFVPKPNCGARLVVDLSYLNSFIERPVHPFMAGTDLIKNLDPKSRVFCKLDAVLGYYQIPLDEESKKLFTFLLASGRYRYLRAPMGRGLPKAEGLWPKQKFFDLRLRLQWPKVSGRSF